MLRSSLETISLTPIDQRTVGSQVKLDSLIWDTSLGNSDEVKDGSNNGKTKHLEVDIGGPVGKVTDEEINSENGEEHESAGKDGWFPPRERRTEDFVDKHGNITRRKDAHTGRSRGAHHEPAKHTLVYDDGHEVTNRKMGYPERKWERLDEEYWAKDKYWRDSTQPYGREKLEKRSTRLWLANEGVVSGGVESTQGRLDELENQGRVANIWTEPSPEVLEKTPYSEGEYGFEDDTINTDDWIQLGGTPQYRQEPMISLEEAQRIEGEEQSRRVWEEMQQQRRTGGIGVKSRGLLGVIK